MEPLTPSSASGGTQQPNEEELTLESLAAEVSDCRTEMEWMRGKVLPHQMNPPPMPHGLYESL